MAALEKWFRSKMFAKHVQGPGFDPHYHQISTSGLEFVNVPLQEEWGTLSISEEALASGIRVLCRSAFL